MGVPKKPVLSMLIFSGLMILIILIMQPLDLFHFGEKIDVLFPKGTIAIKERDLLFIVQGLMLLVVIPVYVLTFIFSWVYRADNKKSKYEPNFVDNFVAECFWWGIPIVMIILISILIWVKTHELDPFKPIESKNKEITIQVVALQWKWLFIYPEEKIASLNFLQIPKDTPIRFEITADAPMNSFWIPKLGGQIYAMPNMKTVLNLIATETGDFRGVSANISGKGFAGMYFITRSSTKEEFDKWIASSKQSPKILTQNEFEILAKPSENNPAEIFQLTDVSLFDAILNKYMPAMSNHNMEKKE